MGTPIDDSILMALLLNNLDSKYKEIIHNLVTQLDDMPNFDKVVTLLHEEDDRLLKREEQAMAAAMRKFNREQEEKKNAGSNESGRVGRISGRGRGNNSDSSNSGLRISENPKSSTYKGNGDAPELANPLDGEIIDNLSLDASTHFLAYSAVDSQPTTDPQIPCALKPYIHAHGSRRPLSDSRKQLCFLDWVSHRTNDSDTEEDELKKCPLIWCRKTFETNELAIRHVVNCPRLLNAWYWCPYHRRPERFLECNKSLIYQARARGHSRA